MEEVKNEGPKEMTLDEWKAMQDKERTKVEFNIRKPNEGADSQWKKGYVLHKSKSEDVSVRIFWNLFTPAAVNSSSDQAPVSAPSHTRHSDLRRPFVLKGIFVFWCVTF